MDAPDLADIRQRLQQIHEDNRTTSVSLGTKMDVLTQANADTQRTLGQLEAQSRALGRDVGTLAKRVEEHEGRLDIVEAQHAEDRGKERAKTAGIGGGIGAAVAGAVWGLIELVRHLATTGGKP